jgi:predicted GIY-YIG superfamily endonuclease
MYYVYILRSIVNQEKTYAGFTSDLQRRLIEHNEGLSRYTAMFKPWRIETFICFSSREKAEHFETYLKHGSGAAFLKKHFLNGVGDSA